MYIMSITFDVASAPFLEKDVVFQARNFLTKNDIVPVQLCY